ncbi:Hypothetical_protein [Hexamita inflata]|uniref:Hypothetical_protein n=1 Tax=Hexamita inflata TaxID=28002 RepID=A0AA86R013_9EUKA|nr:Hypothetical protein HINF_LOCUS54162 [Hexamita inflata]
MKYLQDCFAQTDTSIPFFRSLRFFRNVSNFEFENVMPCTRLFSLFQLVECVCQPLDKCFCKCSCGIQDVQWAEAGWSGRLKSLQRLDLVFYLFDLQVLRSWFKHFIFACSELNFCDRFALREVNVILFDSFFLCDRFISFACSVSVDLVACSTNSSKGFDMSHNHSFSVLLLFSRRVLVSVDLWGVLFYKLPQKLIQEVQCIIFILLIQFTEVFSFSFYPILFFVVTLFSEFYSSQGIIFKIVQQFLQHISSRIFIVLVLPLASCYESYSRLLVLFALLSLLLTIRLLISILVRWLVALVVLSYLPTELLVLIDTVCEMRGVRRFIRREMAALVTYVALFEFFLQLINVRCDLTIVMIHKLMNRVRFVLLQKMIVEILQCSKLVLTQVTCECSVFSYFSTRIELFQVVQLHLQTKVLFLSLRFVLKHFWLSLKLFVVDQIILGGLIGVCRSYFCF